MSSQNARILDLLTERLSIYDPNASTSPGSRLYDEVIAPVMAYIGVDPIDTDVSEFLKARLRQEYPSVASEDGDAVVDLLINPLSLLIEAFKREASLVQLGQSVSNAALMREEDADALAANFFVNRKVGSRAAGIVRMYYANPTYVSVTPGVVFTSASGIRFVPTTTQVFSSDQMLFQRSGAYYYIDVSVIAETPGANTNVAAGTITTVTGLTGFIRFTNLANFVGGVDRETNVELLNRVRTALTERALNTRRGIAARLQDQFPATRAIEVVGYGDPEMQRDVVTGTSEGHVVATGTCFIVGQFCLMLSQFEDRGRDGATRVKEGDIVALNYWNLLYSLPQSARNEEFTVHDIIFDSRESLPDIPSILLFRLSSAPTPASSTLGMLPGSLPGVFCVVRAETKITLSGIPGGILEPTTPNLELEILDNQVHIGGHYDVWIRPVADQEQTANVGPLYSNVAQVAGRQLVTNGGGVVDRNVVRVAYAVSFKDGFSSSSSIFLLGNTVYGETSGAVGTVSSTSIIRYTGSVTLAGVTGNFVEGERIVTKDGSGAVLTGGTVTYVSSDLESLGASPGMSLVILTGVDVGTYRVIDVVGEQVYLDTDLTESETGVHFSLVDEISESVFAPRRLLIPFADALGDDLRTVVGSKRVRVGRDLQQYGVTAGDTLEVLSGNDVGVYKITGFDSTLGGVAPLLDTAMSATNSGVSYEIYRPSAGLSRPLVRVKPGGVHLLDSSGQDSGIAVPYALPLGAYATGAFSGARSVEAGKNGFVLPDPGTSWTPSADLTASRDEFAEALACYSDECIPCDGYIAVVTLMANGQFYLNSNMPTAVKEFFRNMQNWLLNVVDQFGIGADAKAFIHGMTPISFGAPVDAIEFTSSEGTLRTGETLTVGAVSATISDVEQELVVSSTAGFRDGEAIIQGSMSASVRVTSETTLYLTAITGPAGSAFETGTEIIAATTGTRTTPSGVRGRFVVAGTTGGSLGSGDSVLSSATGIAATITLLVAPVLQFEICLPGEMFDGCNNVYVALPEFDWEALLATTDTFAEAVSKYTSGQLKGAPPALSAATPGSILSVGSGANAGTYSVHSVHKYLVGTAGAVVEGVGDLTKCYPVTAVVIDGEFPVASFGNLADFFDAGLPDLSSLPAPGDFPGIGYDEGGILASPWDWVGQFLTWLFRFLDSMGFDLPESFRLDPATTLKAMWQLLFTEYSVGRRTADQTVRVYFQEPTSFTAYGPRPCRRLTYDEPALTSAELRYLYVGTDFGGTYTYDGETFTVAVVTPYSWKTGTFTAAPDELAPSVDLVALAVSMQSQIDPSSSFVTITADGDYLVFTTVAVGQDVTLLTNTADFETAGVFLSPDTSAVGTSTAGTPAFQIYEPPAPTLFSVPVGAEAVLFCASADVAPMRLFPSAQELQDADPPLLPRDCQIPTAYTDATALWLSFSEQTSESWFFRGLSTGDLFQLYEQRELLTRVAALTADTVIERIPALITSAGSATVRLPPVSNTVFTFFSPESDEEADVVQVGDILYIEEGDDTGAYRVSARTSATEVVLDRPLSSSSGSVYFSGNHANTVEGTSTITVYEVAGALSSSHVGKYLTIWASSYRGVSGSYEITAISAVSGGYTLTLDGVTFATAEADVHWAIVRAPVDPPAASALDGNSTELVGVRPFRVYSGRAKEWTVIQTDRTLDPSACRVLIAVDQPVLHNGVPDYTEPRPRPPKVAFRQPYGFVRDVGQHVSSTAMAANREAGLYYADVLVHSLDSRDLANIPKDTRLEPVFGTYVSDGYRIEVVDENYTFSTQEEASLVLSGSILPVGRDNMVENRILLTGRTLAINYQTAPLVAQAQEFLTNRADRILCANPLARHFIPSYVYFSLDKYSANLTTPLTVAQAISDYIGSLDPTDVLEVSKIEGILQGFGVTSYAHPLYLYAVAHDLSRRSVLSRSEDVVGRVVDHNGSNRTTYYIPGTAVSIVPTVPGEYVYLSAPSTVARFR
jgi:hypothetical protein